MVHWFSWFTGSDGSLVQMVHCFSWFTGADGPVGSLVQLFTGSLVSYDGSLVQMVQQTLPDTRSYL